MKKIYWIIGALLMFFVFSCIKGNIEDYPRINMADNDLYGLLYSPSSSVFAIQFDPVLRDPDVGPMILEQLARNSPADGMPAEISKELRYVHGIRIYSLGPDFLFLNGGFLTESVIVMSAEFDTNSFAASLEKISASVNRGELTVYELENDPTIAFLNDKDILLGEKNNMYPYLEKMGDTGNQTGNTLPIQRVRITRGTFVFAYFDMHEILKMKPDLAGTDTTEAEKHILDGFGKMQISISIDGKDVIFELAVEVRDPDSDLAATIIDKIKSSMHLELSEGTPKIEITDWGIKGIQTVSKIKMFEDSHFF